ncbi:MAG: Hpt domain-containing protein [bacterium]
MANKNQFRYNSLAWVKKEVDHSLESARHSILSYLELDNPQYLHTAIDLLRDVLGTLEVADIHGGALLTQECLILVQSIANEEVKHPAEAVQPVVKALLQLPDYLEFVQKDHQDVPVVLVTIINDLRASRDADLLSDSVIDFPAIGSDEERQVLMSGKPLSDSSEKLARALRHIFQLGLLGWYRGKSVEGSLLKMAAVCKRLRDSSRSVEARRLWWLAQGFSEALHSELLESSPAVKMLMGRIDRQIRLLVEHGEEAFSREIPPALIHNLLFYLVGAGDKNLTVNEIKRTYLPDGGLPGDDTLNAARTSVHGPNNLLFQSVSHAVDDDIAEIKDKLEIYERGGETSLLDTETLLPSLRRLGDTLGVLGLGYSREKVLQEVNSLSGIGNDGSGIDLPGLAGVLIEVEREVAAFGEDGRRQLSFAGEEDALLDGQAESIAFSHTREAAVKEIQIDLQACRDAVERYMDGHFDWSFLDDVPGIVARLDGVTQVLSDEKLGQVTSGFHSILDAIKDAQPKTLTQSDLEDFADAIESIGFYLDTYVDSGLAFEHLLFPGQQALNRLGLRWLGEVSVAEPEMLDVPKGPEEALEQHEISLEDSVEEDAPEPGFDQLTETGSLTLADFNLGDAELDLGEAGSGASDEDEQVQEIERIELGAAGGLDVSPETEAGFTRVLEVDDQFPTTPSASANEGSPESIADQRSENVLDDGLALTLSGTLADAGTVHEENPAQELSFDAGSLTLSEGEEAPGLAEEDLESLELGEGDEWGVESGLLSLEDEGDGLPQFPDSGVSLDSAFPEDEGLDVVETSISSSVVEPGTEDGDSVEEIDVSPLTLIDVDRESIDLSKLEPGFASLGEQEGEGVGAAVDVAGEFEGEPSGVLPIEIEASESAVQETAAAASVSPLDGFQVLPDEIDDEIYEIFLEELNEEYEHIKNSLPLWIDSPSDHEHLLQIRRSWHTLKGSGRLVGAEVVGEFAWAHEELLNRVLDGQVPADSEVLDCIRVGTRMLPTLIEQLKTRTSPDKDAGDQVIRAQALSLGHRQAPVDLEEVVADASLESAELEEQASAESKVSPEVSLDASAEGAAPQSQSVELIAPGHDQLHGEEAGTSLEPSVVELGTEDVSAPNPRLDPVLFDIFNAECLQHLDVVGVFAEKAGDGEGKLKPSMDLVRSIHTINGSARTADVPEIYEVSTALERFLDRLSSIPGDGDSGLVNLLQRYSAYIHDVLKSLSDTGAPMPESAPVHALINEALDRLTVDQAIPDVPSGAAGVAPDLVEDQDAELVEVFLEECREILDHCEIAMSRWQNSPEELAPLAELRRELHTLKGGARMAGFRHLGNLSHAVENLLTAVVEGQHKPDSLFLSGLHMGFDQIHGMAEAARKHRPIYSADMAMQVLKKLKDGAPLEPNERELLKIGGESLTSSGGQPADTASLKQLPATGSSEIAPVASEASASEAPDTDKSAVATSSGQLESVRVRSDVLDSLVNNVGEVNVYQSRIEQQLGAFSFNLQELEQTVARLGEQLRRMEMETEAQILFRHDAEPQDPDTTAVQQMFDPLELDRYSNIQQLSRSLKESTSDLQNIHGLLADQTVQLESLQQQQSRISNELQEGLMRTRMVQFSVMIPRLRRVVRQTAMELGKEVELAFKGESSDMDRKVLDSMIVPLEHMLRNAVAHGIEYPGKRVAVGKPSKGVIEVSLSRDGPEIVIAITDDGAGIDTSAVLEKARAKGLVSADTTLTDSEVFAFILEPGFTTAQEVSQIAGRGVGMDVVNSQIKALNGAMDTSSTLGKGASFRIHLPISLAITQALLVRAREHLYAVPLSSIEGVIQLSAGVLKEQFSAENPQVEYAGTLYDLRQLAAAMEHGGMALDDSSSAQPVLLTKVADHNVAFHVDSLEGNREVVVKSVGPLMDSLVGVSGGTILPDGRVVLILDMAGLVRSTRTQEQLLVPKQKTQKATEVERPPVVMVVDDSITIRRVTERMLERNKYQVITAKDGVDAIEKLQTEVPDVMLLDIEMPRMDGFELASHIRNTPAYKDVPIIMITSRTGKKHKDQALGLGVNRFLGKPYQESVLLETIQSMLDVEEGTGATHVIH